MSSFLLLIKRFFYKENTNTFNWDKILLISFALIAFGIGIYLNNQRLDKLTAQRKKNARYTVGITTKVFITKSGRDWVEYYFIMVLISIMVVIHGMAQALHYRKMDQSILLNTIAQIHQMLRYY